MHLLQYTETGDISLTTDFAGSLIPPYAILSHTWGKDTEEVTFDDMKNGTGKNKSGYEKIRFCGNQARQDGLQYFWIDTCCIDKNSSTQLSTAINSMFAWYERASICYAYINDYDSTWELNMPIETGKLDRLSKCKWFTRGWTLQELIAPKRVTFWDCKWNIFGNKRSLSKEISYITGIPAAVMLGQNPRTYNVGQRMSWVASRETKREEDMAYCLMGLFAVNFTPTYGEGAYNAFIRLQKKILKRWSDHSVFIWSIEHDRRNPGLLASTPKAFCKHRKCFEWLE